jgi:putative membrane protein insertion efficiency factor
MKVLIKKLILLYQQAFFSHRRLAQCKYHPSCSEYMLLAIEQYGLWQGIVRGLWRIVRCNPFAKGGLDLP